VADRSPGGARAPAGIAVGAPHGFEIEIVVPCPHLERDACRPVSVEYQNPVAQYSMHQIRWRRVENDHLHLPMQVTFEIRLEVERASVETRRGRDPIEHAHIE